MSDDIARLGFEVDTSPLARAGQQAEKAAQQIGKVGDAADKTSKQVNEAAKSGNTLGTVAQGLSSRFGAVVPILGAVTSGAGALSASVAAGTLVLARAQDQWAQYEGRLKNTLGSVTAARSAINELYKSAQGDGVSFEATISGFDRMARNANELGASNKEILTLSGTIQKLGIVSGASTGELSSGILQLSQALASGRLNGDELRSIMENMPALAKAIADGLGVSVGQLRSMGEQGQLTSDKVFKAILSQSDKIQDQFKNLPDTTERAFTRVSDAWSKMLANMGQATNSSGFIQTLLNGTAGLLNLINGNGKTGSAEQNQLTALLKLQSNLQKLPGADRENSDTWRRLQTVEAQIKALQPVVAAQRNDAADAAAAENYRPAIARFSQGATASKQAQTLSGTQSELIEQIRTIETALIAAGRRGTSSVLPADQQPTTQQIEAMESSLVSLRAKLADTTTAIGKLTQGTSDYREAVRLGGAGGGVEIVTQAQSLARQMQAQGINASTGSTIGAVISDRVTRAGEDVTALDRQTKAQQALADSVGKTRQEILDAEVAQGAYEYRIKTFGTITTPAVEKAVAAYTAALRRNKQATQDLADEQQYSPLLKQLAQGVANTRAQAGAGSFAALSRMQLEQNIASTTKDMPAGIASQVAVKMRAQYEADIAKSLNDQTLTLEEQIGLQSEQSKITGLTSDEYEVQQALLAKKVELQRQGVDLASEEAVRVMQLTEQVVRQNQQIDKAKTQAQEWQNTWKSAGTGVTSSLSSAFVALFDKQQKAADVLKSGLSSTFKSLAQNIMDQMLKPLSDYIAKMLAQMAAYGFTGSVGVGTNASAGTASIPSNVAANGAYFSNGIAAFANGGTFTNSIVSSPTLFKFANGGAVKTGLMGEAGEEAIMPLRRDASGRLGVSAASGGGNNISISISVDASGGTQTQAAGDTSDNQGRKLGEAISAAVKNEILQQQRPGGLLSKRS